jgi:TFIIF-interacting CTD phosphatase-like protein
MDKLQHVSKIKNKIHPLVILDLDNTCICSVEMRHLDKVKHPETFQYIDLETYYRIYERPGLQPFLDELFLKYKVGVWTAAGFDYAKFIIDHFIISGSKNRNLEFFMWDKHCTYSETHSTQIKDVTLLQGLYPKLVLLDDNADVLRQNNVINSRNFNVLLKRAQHDDFFKHAPSLISDFFGLK